MSTQIFAGLALAMSCFVAGQAQSAELALDPSTQNPIRLAQFEKPRSPNALYTPPKPSLPVGIDRIVEGDVWPPMPLKSNDSMAHPLANGEVVAGLQLSARPKKYQVEVLDTIVVEIVLKNTTDKSIEIYSTSVNEKDFVAEVQDVNGQNVPLTVYGKLLDPTSAQMPYSGNLILGSQKVEIKPHQEFTDELTLNQINDMSLSGSYFVSIKYSGAKNLKTNTVQIDVFPRNQLPKTVAASATKE